MSDTAVIEIPIDAIWTKENEQMMRVRRRRRRRRRRKLLRLTSHM